ncbi:NTP transferase domain-containing protein [Quadrisphaera sp. INWT6]|uniref:phosphocholine cytidylyltransferase family protein n=1 Tax=Quadrisphaera sp. INWT6 TaxID=2596917 RepID=UPI0018926781|nr:NTP transferase domain-containing protein [Quadrisphaera sp. INWT6]MBF5082247.1 NTP transferase domain-containing protein [Quadrisphaera sp. INWT6]
MTLQAVVLAAGKGTRLGRPLPKPLTQLADGRSILVQQVENLRTVLGEQLSITAVVGFKAALIMEAVPTLLFAYNEDYEDTNTSKSLLRALELSADGPVLWLNGDVVFDPTLLDLLLGPIARGESAVCVNTASVGEEEVKYTVDAEGFIADLSKTVVGGLGEAVGINLVSASDKALLVEKLRECGDQDYFERGIELAIAAGMRVLPVDISEHVAVEVDFEEDLVRAERLVAEHHAAHPTA